MPKNTRTYVLIALVLIIWGVLGFRFLTFIQPDEIDTNSITKIDNKVVSETIQDTFSIKNDYPDPFWGSLAENRTKKSISRAISAETHLPFVVRYTGSIVNATTGSRLFFISVDNEDYLMRKGDVIKGFRLINGTSTSVTVRYQKITKKIDLEN